MFFQGWCDMEFSDMNFMAWEIAVLAMMRKGRDVAAYSSTQIRKFLSLSQMSNTEITRAIDESIRLYTPQPTKAATRNDPNPDPRYLEKQKKKNAVIGEKIKDALTRMDTESRMKFVQYLLWDTKIIEQGFRIYREPIPFFKKLFDVEKIENSNELIKKLESLASYDTREGRGSGQEFKTGYDRRRSRS
ncbi:MAG: hypothetical protein A4E35_00829 [Methanoregula sp. PtaU1.Bin051]|nr:MAG: hypothetical protein A4E35_00829 [Methanoregula sp. PtaU1.Bin051]